MDDAQRPNSILPSTVERITTDCSKFRILILGKTGCGKSSLINKVFGVDLAKVFHDRPGEADIQHEFCPEDNVHFILHDSEGFEPGDDTKFSIVRSFIEQRSKMPLLKDRLHAIWICISVPLAGNRLTETGVESIFNLDRGGIPVIAVLTKYDTLVMSEIFRADTAIHDLDEEKTQLYGEEKAQESFEKLCKKPLIELVDDLRLTKVSAQPRYEETIAQLIDMTDKEVKRHINNSSHASPVSLAWAVAQRGNLDVNIEASIDVGRERYWSGLLSSTDFTGQKLRQCLDVIHADIIAVWNFHDPDNYLLGEEFKERMSHLVQDLVPHPQTPTAGIRAAPAMAALATAPHPFGIAVAAIWSAGVFARWVHDVYCNTPINIACMMGYIVDLTIVMRKLSSVSVSKKNVVSALEGYISGEITEVHNDIRKFVNDRSSLRLTDKDDSLNEIIRLIHRHRVGPNLSDDRPTNLTSDRPALSGSHPEPDVVAEEARTETRPTVGQPAQMSPMLPHKENDVGNIARRRPSGSDDHDYCCTWNCCCRFSIPKPSRS